jgi:hypothetical protein
LVTARTRAVQAQLYAASVEGRGVLAERGEPGVQRLGRSRDARPLFLPGELCASHEGYSLHAKVALEADDHVLALSELAVSGDPDGDALVLAGLARDLGQVLLRLGIERRAVRGRAMGQVGERIDLPLLQTAAAARASACS